MIAPIEQIIPRWILISFVLLIFAVISGSANEENPPVFPGEIWQTAMPDGQGLKPEAFEEAINYLNANSGGAGTAETVVIRNGYLLWKGQNADRVHELYSCTKTFTSTVLGLLEKDGVLKADDNAVDYYPELDDTYPEYAKIKLSHLASMTSGYDGAMGGGWNFYQTDRETHHRHVLAYTAPGPPMFVAGASFQYHDPAVHLLGYILTKMSGESLETIFKKRVADPIGMEHFSWSNYGSRNGMFFNNPAGTPGDNQGGIYTSSLDAARYGLLYLNGGTWDGKQILEPAFVERATSNQVGVTLQTKYMDLTGRYGFFWWTNGVKKNRERPWPSAPPKTYAAHGAGRNFIFVIPEWRMVLVRLSPAPGGQVHIGGIEEGVWEAFFSRLKKALKP